MYKIIVDSVVDFDEKLFCEYKDLFEFKVVPYHVEIDGVDYIDDDSLTVNEKWDLLLKAKDLPKTACPSSQTFLTEFENTDKDVFVITTSNGLTGTFSSSTCAKNMFFEEYPDSTKKIHIIDSLSASGAAAIVVLKLLKFAKENLSFEEIAAKTEEYVKKRTTLIIVNDIKPLVKTGRISPVAASIAGMLNIKPILSGDENGKTVKYDQVRGFSKALKRLVEIALEKSGNCREEVYIAHRNNEKAALFVKEQLLNNGFQKVYITYTNLASSMYATDGGIVVGF